MRTICLKLTTAAVLLVPVITTGCGNKEGNVKSAVASEDPSRGFKAAPGARPQVKPGPGEIDPAQKEALNKEAESAGK